MLLREFFNFNNDSGEFEQDKRYNPANDSSSVSMNDTRKIKLTLRQINQLRLQSEARKLEKQQELDLLQRMYGAQSGEEAP